jgi:Uma2 family endonuclease
MSTVGSALVTWDEFVRLEDSEEGARLELHDGQVVAVPPAKPIHTYIQRILAKWLTSAADGLGADEMVPVAVLPGAASPVSKLFEA